MSMGLPVQTKEGQLYVATQKAGREALEQSVKRQKDANITVAENSKASISNLAKVMASGDMDKMRMVLRASAGAGGDLAKVLSATQNSMTNFMKDGKMMSEEEIKAKLEGMMADKKKEESAAASAVDTQRAFQNLSNQLLEKLMPVLNLMLDWGIKGAFWLASFVDPLMKLVGGAGGPLDRLVELFGVLDSAFSGEGGLVQFIQDTAQQFIDMIMDLFDIVVDVTKMFLESDAFKSLKTMFKKMMGLM
jgi:hypothetical protein